MFFSLESPGNSAEMSVQTLLSILVHASGRTDVEPTRAAVLVLVLLGDGWRETMSQDRHDRAAAAADSNRPRGRPSPYRAQRGGWGPRSSRGRRPQCK